MSTTNAARVGIQNDHRVDKLSPHTDISGYLQYPYLADVSVLQTLDPVRIALKIMIAIPVVEMHTLPTLHLCSRCLSSRLSRVSPTLILGVLQLLGDMPITIVRPAHNDRFNLSEQMLITYFFLAFVVIG